MGSVFMTGCLFADTRNVVVVFVLHHKVVIEKMTRAPKETNGGREEEEGEVGPQGKKFAFSRNPHITPFRERRGEAGAASTANTPYTTGPACKIFCSLTPFG